MSDQLLIVLILVASFAFVVGPPLLEKLPRPDVANWVTGES